MGSCALTHNRRAQVPATRKHIFAERTQQVVENTSEAAPEEAIMYLREASVTRLSIPALLLAVIVPAFPATKHDEAKEAPIRQLVADFNRARNTCDPAALVRLYAEDAEYILFAQTPIRGREIIKGAWCVSPCHAHRTIRNIRFIHADAAIVRIAVHFSNDKATLDYNDTLLVVRKSRRWQILVQETALPPNEFSVANALLY
jgi:uncharacterized protein (TIGR02246 family)